MTSHDDKRTRPTRAQRLVAFGFLGAFGLTLLTVLLTGLWVRSPNARRAEPPVVPHQAEQPSSSDRGVQSEVEQPLEPNRTTDETLPAQGAHGPDADGSEEQAARGQESKSDRAADAAPR